MWPRIVRIVFVFSIWSSIDPVAMAQRVQADQGGIAIGGSVTGSTVIIGIRPEQLAALIRQSSDLSEANKTIIESLERDLALTRRQISGALRVLGEENVPPEQLGEKLAEIAQRFRELQAKISDTDDDIHRVAQLKAKAKEAIAVFELSKADDILEQIEAEQRRQLAETAVSIAETSARRGEVALTRLRYDEAAGHFAKAEMALPAESSYDTARISYAEGRSYALFVLGTERNDMRALQQAVENYDRLVDMQPRERVPVAWAIAQVNSAYSRIIQTTREFDQRFGLPPAAFKAEQDGSHPDPFNYKDKLQRVEIEVERFGVALQELPPDVPGLEWPRCMARWGEALSTLGDIYDEFAQTENALKQYNDAANKVEAALTMISQSDAPALWVATQERLASILSKIGTTTSNKDTLQDVVSLREAALKMRNRTSDPVKWALAETSLANSIDDLGRLSGDPSYLERSITMRREALTELSRERSPMAWAYALRNLGQALVQQSQKDSGTDTKRLEEAAEAFEKSFEVSSDWRTRLFLLQTRTDLENRGTPAMHRDPKLPSPK